MKVNGKYKFSLQFPDDSEENHQVGELLERLGNKKSAFLVPVLFTYLKSHPELSNSPTKIKIQIDAPIRRDELKQMIYEIIEEKFHLANLQPSLEQTNDDVQIGDSDIEEMLDNLDIFAME